MTRTSRRTLAQAIREAGVVLTPDGAAEVAEIDANPMGPMAPTAAVGWCVPLADGLTLQAVCDMSHGWSVVVAENEPIAGRQLPYAVRAAAKALSDAIADYWMTSLEITIAGLATEPELSEQFSEDAEQIRRLAEGLRNIIESVGAGGWFPVADCKLSADDIHALWSAAVLRVQPRIEAGSYCIEFESDAVLSGRGR